MSKKIGEQSLLKYEKLYNWGRTLITSGVIQNEDKFPSELSCAERTVSAPQSVTANLTAASAVVSFLYDLLICGELNTRYITFSSRQINMRAEMVEKRKKTRKNNQTAMAA